MLKNNILFYYLISNINITEQLSLILYRVHNDMLLNHPRPLPWISCSASELTHRLEDLMICKDNRRVDTNRHSLLLNTLTAAKSFTDNVSSSG